MTSVRVPSDVPESRLTIPEFGVPLSIDGDECDAYTTTLLEVDSGPIVRPSVRRVPSAVLTTSETSAPCELSVIAWILPIISLTYRRPSGPHSMLVGLGTAIELRTNAGPAPVPPP